MSSTAQRQRLAYELSLIRQFQELASAPEQPAQLTSPPGATLNCLFFLTVGGSMYVGRKLLTCTPDRGWQQSSCLSSSHLLGRLLNFNYGKNGFSVSFITLDEVNKKRLFYAAIHQPNSAVFFPFPLLGSAGQECVLTPADWACSGHLVEQLDRDELHFREYCASFLKPLIGTNSVLYDPACSTGAFINAMAQAFPEARCIGSDHSASMIEHARQSYPMIEFHHANAATMSETVSRSDVLFLRFLNAEVLYRDEAHQIFFTLANALKPGARLILFGHTPVLLNVGYWSQKLGLTLISSLAARTGHLELFEFYVMEAP